VRVCARPHTVNPKALSGGSVRHDRQGRGGERAMLQRVTVAGPFICGGNVCMCDVLKYKHPKTGSTGCEAMMGTLCVYVYVCSTHAQTHANSNTHTKAHTHSHTNPRATHPPSPTALCAATPSHGSYATSWSLKKFSFFPFSCNTGDVSGQRR